MHNQILCDFKGDEIYGGAFCPYCGHRNSLAYVDNRCIVDPEDRCAHADMAVDAGALEVAIHFTKNT